MLIGIGLVGGQSQEVAGQTGTGNGRVCVRACVPARVCVDAFLSVCVCVCVCLCVCG